MDLIFPIEFGTHQLKHFTRIEEGKLAYYGFCITRDKNGNVLSQSNPEKIMEMYFD